MDRTLLLVDDEENILAALTRLLRHDGYHILRATGGKEGLELLDKNNVGVVISDQRMPQMTGVQFLGEVKEKYPDTVRIVLSGYTDLNSVTDSINKGAIYKFLTKPWDDDLLRNQVKDAFETYELKRENLRLNTELKILNKELESINDDLERRVEIKTREVMINFKSLRVSQEIVDSMPAGVIGVSDHGNIVVANSLAHVMFDESMLIGRLAKELLPEEINKIISAGNQPRTLEAPVKARIGTGIDVNIRCCRMGHASSRGWVIVFTGNQVIR